VHRPVSPCIRRLNTHRIAEGNPISEAAEEEKLRLVADVAHAAWG
jgi:hypothetical protein